MFINLFNSWFSFFFAHFPFLYNIKYKGKFTFSQSIRSVRSFSCLENPKFENIRKNSDEISIFLHYVLGS